MTLQTKYFGEINYDAGTVIEFPHGLPGFPDTRKYLLLTGDASDSFFYWLQCVDDGNIAFTLVDVYQLLPDYNPLVESEELAELGELTEESLEIYNVSVVPEDVKQMRVNLKAPVVINHTARKGKQVIVSNDEYRVRHYIFEEMAAAKTGR